ncbi:hypothetical protein LPB41_15580 [Thalassospira sp. MA62]|nr:hypothetical protein [Thalassospira sp. MA62]
MRKLKIGSIAAVAVLALLSGCIETTSETNVRFTDNLQSNGRNPFITEPLVRNLEQRMVKIALADNPGGPPNDTRFNQRNQTILNNFSDQFDQNRLNHYISLSQLDFSTAAQTLYPVIGDQTNCILSNDPVYFSTGPGSPPRTFDWQFVTGTCANGMADGVGKVTDPTNNAQFVGTFRNGIPTDGIFTASMPDGKRLVQIGELATTAQTARRLNAEFISSSARFVYGDFNRQGQRDGFAINVIRTAERLVVRSIGEFNDGVMNGFGAQQELFNYEYGGNIWDASLGMYANGKLNGWAAHTDNVNTLVVGEWVDGKLNGVGYETRTSVGMSIHQQFAGTYVNGLKEGSFQEKRVALAGTFEETHTYKNGKLADEGALDGGQLLALAAGAVMITTSDIDPSAMAEIGGAFSSDVLGDTGGTNMQNLRGNLQSQLNSQNASSNGSSASATSTPLNIYKAHISCPDTGVTATIDVPYRTEACRVAAVDFAKTFSCNMTDQERVMQNCQQACGHPQCLQQ